MSASLEGQEENMAVQAFSDERGAQFKDGVNKSAAYKAGGKGWKWTVGLGVEAEPDKHFPESRGLVMGLFDGDARDIRVGSAGDAQKCDFVITAPYTCWKQVATKELEATKGMPQGKLKLKGDLPAIVRYTKASQELTECTTRVSTEWPDEQ